MKVVLEVIIIVVHFKFKFNSVFWKYIKYKGVIKYNGRYTLVQLLSNHMLNSILFPLFIISNILYKNQSKLCLVLTFS